MVCLTLYSGIW